MRPPPLQHKWIWNMRNGLCDGVCVWLAGCCRRWIDDGIAVFFVFVLLFGLQHAWRRKPKSFYTRLSVERFNNYPFLWANSHNSWVSHDIRDAHNHFARSRSGKSNYSNFLIGWKCKTSFSKELIELCIRNEAESCWWHFNCYGVRVWTAFIHCLSRERRLRWTNIAFELIYSFNSDLLIGLCFYLDRFVIKKVRILVGRR